MKIQFKIYNPDIVDCSSCPNTIYPDPESRDVLLEILLKICESDVVYRIGQFKFWLDEIELQSPNVYGTDYKSWKKDDSRYDLQVGNEAELNKLLGLHVEREEDARDRINEPSWDGKYGLFKCKKAFYIEPGLDGIQKGIEYIKFLYKNQKEELPTYLRDLNLRHFGFTSGVIWGMDANRQKSENGMHYDIDYEWDYISGGSGGSGFTFGFGNSGGAGYEIFGLKKYLYHLNSITRILDEINPGKYEAGPDDYYGLLKWGILKKKGRKLVPTDIDDAFEATNNFEKEKSQIYSAKTWISDIIYDSNSLPIQKFAKILKISLVDAENLIYELAAEGIDGVLEEGVIKFIDKPYKVVSKLEELIDKIESETSKKEYERIRRELERIGVIISLSEEGTLQFEEITKDELEKLDENTEIYAITIENINKLEERLKEKAKRLEEKAKKRLNELYKC